MFCAALPMLHRTSPLTGWHLCHFPSSAQELYKHFRTAEDIIAMMDRPDANKQLEKCSGIGPGKSSQIMKSWQDAKNRREQSNSRAPSLPSAGRPRNRMHVALHLFQCFVGREMPSSLRHEARAPRVAPASPVTSQHQAEHLALRFSLAPGLRRMRSSAAASLVRSPDCRAS